MKKYLSIVLLAVVSICYAKSNTAFDNKFNASDNSLLIQLIDSKLANMDNKLTTVIYYNKNSISDLKISTDEKLADKFKQLDDKGVYVGWWLNVLAIWLTLVGILAPIGAYLLNRKITENIREAKGTIQKQLDEADKLLKSIKNNHKKSQKFTESQQKIRANPPENLTKLTEQNKQDIRRISELSKAQPENQLTAEDWFIKGLNAQNNKEHYEAVTFYNQSIKLSPTNCSIYNNRGNAKLSLNQYEEAIQDYSRAIELGFHDGSPYFNRGVAKYHLGEYADAIQDLNEVIKLNPQDVEAYCNRGAAKCELELYTEAIQDCNEAIRLDSKNNNIYNCRGIAKHKLARYKEAIKDYSKAIELNSQDNRAYYNKACSYALMENKTEALQCLEEALKLNYSILDVLKDEDWKKYLHDSKFKTLVEKYTK